jgi:2-polyprenyl-3-methyl-5-hydroxy-6-metoxy-1,4-benzoquinol methylase
MKKIDICPICSSATQAPLLVCKDYTVSKKDFSIVACADCGFAFTSPRPEDSDLGAYYQSEEYISHSNTSKGLVSKLYQMARKRTLAAKLQMINARASKGALLDIGCGTGEFLNECKLNGWRVQGIEPGEAARSAASSNYGLSVGEESAIDGLAEASFEVITMWHVMEHVPNLVGRVQQLKRLLKPGGLLVIAVPNRSSHDAEYYGAQWAAYDVPRHLWHFRPEDMKRLLEQGGFKLTETLPMKYDSYYVSMLSEKYKTGAVNYLAAAYRGWVSNSKAGKDRWSSQIYLFRHA